MPDRPPETPETEGLPQRALILLVHQELKRLNGSVKHLCDDTYGDPTRQIIGLKDQVRDLASKVERHHDEFDLIKAQLAVSWKIVAAVLAPVLASLGIQIAGLL